MSGIIVGTPIETPPVVEVPTNSALLDIAELVNNEVENHPILLSIGFEGNGEQRTFHVAPTSRYVVDDDTLAVYLDGAMTEAYTMDFDSGDLSFTSAPADLSAIWVEFSHQVWTMEMIESSVVAAVGAIFPAFYRSTVEDIVANGTDHEFELTTEAIDCIRQIESGTTSVGPWTAIKHVKYDSFWSGDTLTIRFFTPPTGYIRAHLICRPSFVSEIVEEVTITTLNVPNRAIDPIVSYACFYLLTQKMAPRVRTDTAVNTYGNGTLSPRQMNDASNAFYLRYQMQLATTKMRPWSGV